MIVIGNSLSLGSLGHGECLPEGKVKDNLMKVYLCWMHLHFMTPGVQLIIANAQVRHKDTGKPQGVPIVWQAIVDLASGAEPRDSKITFALSILYEGDLRVEVREMPRRDSKPPFVRQGQNFSGKEAWRRESLGTWDYSQWQQVLSPGHPAPGLAYLHRPHGRRVRL